MHLGLDFPDFERILSLGQRELGRGGGDLWYVGVPDDTRRPAGYDPVGKTHRIGTSVFTNS